MSARRILGLGQVPRVAPRCRLITSWGWRRSQGSGCSPVKAVRELGSKRRETVWSLSAVGAGYLRTVRELGSERRETVRSLSAVGVGSLRGAVPSTRGPGWTDLWCVGCSARSRRRVAMSGRDKR